MIDSIPMSLVAMAALLAITFAYSTYEKLIDFKGYLSKLQGQFYKNAIANYLEPILILILILEIVTTVLLVYGAYELITSGSTITLYFAGMSAVITLLMLLLGQRIAKDYQSSANISFYSFISIFMLVIIEIYR